MVTDGSFPGMSVMKKIAGLQPRPSFMLFMIKTCAHTCSSFELGTCVCLNDSQISVKQQL